MHPLYERGRGDVRLTGRPRVQTAPTADWQGRDASGHDFELR